MGPATGPRPASSRKSRRSRSGTCGPRWPRRTASTPTSSTAGRTRPSRPSRSRRRPTRSSSRPARPRTTSGRPCSDYAVLDGDVPLSTAYGIAHDAGRALTETPYPTLNEKAERLAQSIIDRLVAVTAAEKAFREMRSADRTRRPAPRPRPGVEGEPGRPTTRTSGFSWGRLRGRSDELRRRRRAGRQRPASSRSAPTRSNQRLQGPRCAGRPRGVSRPTPAGGGSPRSSCGGGASTTAVQMAGGGSPRSSCGGGASTTAVQMAGGWRSPQMIARYASGRRRRGRGRSRGSSAAAG